MKARRNSVGTVLKTALGAWYRGGEREREEGLRGYAGKN